MYKLYQVKIDKYNFNIVLENNYVIYLNTTFHDVYLDFKDKTLVLSNNDDIKNIVDELTKYFKGELKKFTFKYKLIGTEFQINVWEKLKEVPYGKNISYKELAINSGSPKGARAIGNAVGKNPLLIFIPCHRVIKNDGSIGGFSSDINIKYHLQQLESSNI